MNRASLRVISMQDELKMDFDFVAPQLPMVMSGEQFMNYTTSMQFEAHAEETQQVAAALDAYNRAQNEYELRNMHYAAWLTWCREHPNDGARVVAFATDHNDQFVSACRAYEALDQALARWEERSRVLDVRAQFQPALQANKQDGPRLARQLAAIQTAITPAAANQPSSAASLPQKRPRPA